MNADKQEQTNGANAIPASPLSLLIRVHPRSSAFIRGHSRFSISSESQLPLPVIRVPTLSPCLSAFIRVHPRPFLLLDQHRLHLVRDRPLHQVSPEHAAHRVPKLAQVLLPEASLAHHLPLFLQETRVNPSALRRRRQDSLPFRSDRKSVV